MAEETTTTSMVNSDWVNNSDRQNKINTTYNDISTNAQNNLTTSNTEGNAAYDQNANNIQSYYDAAAKNVEAEYEKNKRLNDVAADANGLNTGNGSQLALGQRTSMAKAQGILNKSQQEQTAQNDLARQKMNIQYTNSMAEAVANGDYVKAAALLDEYSNEYDNMSKQAESASAFGDFSGYETLYGKEAADNMKTVWEYQNPLIAYNLGQITADKYYQLTGSYPPGYVVYSGGGDDGYYGDGNLYDTTLNSYANTAGSKGATYDNWMVGWTASGGGSNSRANTSSSGLTHYVTQAERNSGDYYDL